MSANQQQISRVEPWLWGLVAPVPSVAFAVWLGAMLGPPFHSPQVGISVGTAVLVSVGCMAGRRKGVCAAAFVAGVAALALAAFGLFVYALSHMTFG